jgi:hypothetical protein
VPVPDQGPDPLDAHGEPVEPDGLGEARRRELAEWCRKWTAEGEAPKNLDDALRNTIREEVDRPEQVEPEFENVMRLVRVASVPFMITHEMARRLRILGYSDDAIRHLTPQEAQQILAQGPGATEA